jgi:transcriptional regulator with XRE-family HTH domain
MEKRGVFMANSVGEKIKARRLELGWSLRELASRMGYANQSTVARIESGVIDIPQSKVVKFAEVMGTTVAFLMDWEQVQKKNDALTDIVVRLRTDNEFFSLMEGINQLNPEQLASVKQVVSAFRSMKG